MFKTISNHKRLILYLIIANLYLILSNLPLAILVSRTPKDTIFPLYHTPHIYDHNVYLSAINQGRNGAWLMRDAFTSEPTNPTTFYIFYVFLGKITSFFNLSPQYIYHVGRLFSAELFIVSLYLFNKVILAGNIGFTASLIAIIGTISPIFLFNQPGAFTQFYPWWANLEALERMNSLPHYLFGYSLLFITVALFISFIRKKKTKHLLAAVFLVFIGGIIFPPSLLPIVIALPVSLLLNSIISYLQNKKNFFTKHQLFGCMIITFIGFLSLLIIWHENQNGFPWNIWNIWEIQKWNFGEPSFNRSLLLSFGILPLIAIPGLIFILRQNLWEYIFISVWASLPFILLPFINILGISKLRLVSIAPFVPLGILFSITFSNSLNFEKKLPVKIILLVIFLASILPVTAHTLVRNIKTAQTFPFFANFYITLSKWRAIEYMKKSFPNDTVILSNEYVGNLIPAYTNSRSFFGHTVHTKDFFQKQSFVWRFYRNGLENDVAKELIKNYGISYVFYGPEEQNLGSRDLSYNFLKIVYNDSGIAIYRIIL